MVITDANEFVADASATWQCRANPDVRSREGSSGFLTPSVSLLSPFVCERRWINVAN
jgi:hypothetical protein